MRRRKVNNIKIFLPVFLLRSQSILTTASPLKSRPQETQQAQHVSKLDTIFVSSNKNLSNLERIEYILKILLPFQFVRVGIGSE